MSAAPLLLLILFDGLGHDLFHRHIDRLGNLKKIYENGPKIKKGVTPVFPALTTPNLMSIATGLYPESHDITANYMKAYPYESEKYNHTTFNLFTESDEDATWWDNSLNMPIWSLNEQVPGRSSGGMFWSGSGSSYRGRNIRYYQRYDANNSWVEEVDGVLEWFTDKHRPANCVFLYFDEPDLTLHHYGTNSEEFMHQLDRVNDIVGYLMEKLDENSLTDSMNIVILSDHGMIDVPVDNYIEIENMNISGLFTGHHNSVIWNIIPYPGQFQVVHSTLSEGARTLNYSVWMKSEFPESAHYKKATHIGSIILVSDPGYRTVPVKFDNVTSVQGSHGYNNTCPEMRSMFIAQGPAFNSSSTLDSFENVDLYPLMCKILNLKPSANNGSFDRVSSLLLQSNNRQTITKAKLRSADYVAIGVGVALIVLVLFALILFANRMFKKSRRNKLKHQYGLVGNGNPFLSDSDSDGL